MKGAQQKESAAGPLLDAEEAHRVAVARREKKAEILEEAKATVAKLREERGAALKADDSPRTKKLTTALSEAREVLDLAEQDHEIAAEDEKAAADEFARLTAEDTARRHQELVAALLDEHAKLAEIQGRACQEIFRAGREMDRVEEELRGAGEKDKASALRESRPRHTFQVAQAIGTRVARVAEPSPAAPDS